MNYLPSARDGPTSPAWYRTPETTPELIKLHYIINPLIFFLRA